MYLKYSTLKVMEHIGSLRSTPVQPTPLLTDIYNFLTPAPFSTQNLTPQISGMLWRWWNLLVPWVILQYNASMPIIQILTRWPLHNTESHQRHHQHNFWCKLCIISFFQLTFKKSLPPSFNSNLFIFLTNFCNRRRCTCLYADNTEIDGGRVILKLHALQKLSK